ncbi:MAG: hypothetical protein ACJA0Y_000900 [Maricaulis maris]|jgi:hypothetical protein
MLKHSSPAVKTAGNWLWTKGLPIAWATGGAAWFVSAIVYPWFYAGGDWSIVQEVWARWQGVNTGALAALASIFIFLAARHHESERRNRAFIVAKGFAPRTLSETLQFLEAVANWYSGALDGLSNAEHFEDESVALQRDVPTAEHFEEHLRDLAVHSDGALLGYILRIPRRLQVITTRMERRRTDLLRVSGGRGRTNLLEDVAYVCVTHAAVTQLFEALSRDERPSPELPTVDDCRRCLERSKFRERRIAEIEKHIYAPLASFNRMGLH